MMPDGGNGGSAGLWLPAPGDREYRRHLRQHCRDVVDILTFRRADGSTVISEAEAAALIRAAVPLAAKAARDGRARDYRSVMSVLTALAKLEQDERPQEHHHLYAEVDVEGVLSRMRIECERQGLLGVEPGGNGDSESDAE